MTPILQHNLPIGTFAVFSDQPMIQCAQVKQTHSNKVLLAQDSTPAHEADGLYCLNQNLIPLAVKTADCLPIIVCGHEGVALVHAGWRGLASRILCPKNLDPIAPYSFFIGPSIGVDHYEVQPDFTSHFPTLKHCFTSKDKKNYFDLKKAAFSIIEQNYPLATIHSSHLDTFTNPLLHSYRKNKTDQRNWNIWLPKGVQI